jgi:hypothetical protein
MDCIVKLAWVSANGFSLLRVRGLSFECNPPDSQGIEFSYDSAEIGKNAREKHRTQDAPTRSPR